MAERTEDPLQIDESLDQWFENLPVEARILSIRSFYEFEKSMNDLMGFGDVVIRWCERTLKELEDSEHETK